MKNDGLRDVLKRIAQPMTAEADIDIFEVGEEMLVEESCFVEKRPTVEGGSGAGREHPCSRVEVPGRVSVPAFGGHAMPGKKVASILDDSGIAHVDHARGYSADGRWSTLDGIMKMQKPVGAGGGVGVKEPYVLRTGGPDSNVDGGGEPPVVAEGNNIQRGNYLLRYVDRAIC